MQKQNITNSIVLKIFNEKDLIIDHKNLIDMFYKIAGGYNLGDMRETIDNINGDIFLFDKKVFAFVLEQNDEPISFAVFSKKSNHVVTLDIICTDIEYSKLGFATILLRLSAIELKSQNITHIIVDTKDQNEITEELLNSFSKVENVDTQKDEKQSRFDIKNMNDEKMLDDIKTMII